MTIYGGRLGTPQILATTDLTEVYSVPIDYWGIANVTLTNRSSSLAPVIKIAISDSITPGDEEYIEWNTTITPRGILERTQLFLQAGRKILVQTTEANVVAVTVYGFLQDTVIVSEEQANP
jgi:hypothetical protein